MDERLKHRLVGAAVLVSLGVIFIPMVLDNAGRSGDAITATNIPPKPEGGFSSRVVPVEVPLSTLAGEPLPAVTVEEGGIYGAVPVPEPEPGPLRSEAPPPAPAPAVQPTPRPTPQPTAQPTPSPASTAEQQAAAPSPDAGARAAAARKAAEEGVTAWAVQLGSFSNAQNAITLRDRLREKGYTAFVESAPSTGRSMTRVYVGPELVRTRALEMLENKRDSNPPKKHGNIPL